MLQALDAAAVRQWCVAGRDALRAAREEIDRLNVYPVPDGDTGTNLLVTMDEVVGAVEGAGDDLPLVAAAMASGALHGARGNSGVILAQLLKGLADAMPQDGAASAEHVQAGLVRAAQLAYGAVGDPAEGTVLSVAREAAAAAAELGPVDLAAVVRAAHAGAVSALARTTEALPALAAAGVVDAGGRGLCVLLEALVGVVTGDVPQAAPAEASQPTAPAAHHESDGYAYEVQYLLRDTDEQAVEALKARLSALGDSLVVVGDSGTYNVHVHVDDVGAAVEAGVVAGRPFRITVTRFADAPQAQPAAEPTGGRAVVAVASGEGLLQLFEEAGAVGVAGGPVEPPTTAALLAAARRTGAAEVVLLPNDVELLTVASEAAAEARREGMTAAVVPTRSVVQGLAALAVFERERPLHDDIGAMAAAAGSTRWAQVTVAVREAATMAGICRPGDVLGLIEGDVVLIGDDVEETAHTLLDRLLMAGGELVTVVLGEDAAPGAGERLEEHVRAASPAAETVVYEGGQRLYPVLLGVE